MYPRAFEYARAESLQHAIELLDQHGSEARVLAGGASLIPLMKLRLATPSVLVDIGRLAELSFVRREDGTLVVGALTRHAEVDPAGDWAPALLALGGSVRAVSSRGQRTIAAAEFFQDAFTTALEPDEVLAEVHFPLWGPRSGSAHLKLERRAGDFALAHCSVALALDEAGRCGEIGVGLGGVGLSPVKVIAAEALLRGQELRDDLVQETARVVSRATEAFSDVRATAEYRQHVAGVLFQRALEAARRRAIYRRDAETQRASEK